MPQFFAPLGREAGRGEVRLPDPRTIKLIIETLADIDQNGSSYPERPEVIRL